MRRRSSARNSFDSILHRDGEWFLSLTMEIEKVERSRTGEAAIVLDWVLRRFCLACAMTAPGSICTTRASISLTKQ